MTDTDQSPTPPAQKPDARRDAAISLSREIRHRLEQQSRADGRMVFAAVVDESITRGIFGEIILMQLDTWSREGNVDASRVWENQYGFSCNIPNRTCTHTNRLRSIKNLMNYPPFFTIDVEGKQWGNSFFDFFFSFLPADDYASLRALVIKRHIDNLAYPLMGVR